MKSSGKTLVTDAKKAAAGPSFLGRRLGGKARLLLALCGQV